MSLVLSSGGGPAASPGWKQKEPLGARLIEVKSAVTAVTEHLKRVDLTDGSREVLAPTEG